MLKLFTEMKARQQKTELAYLHFLDMFGHDISMFEYKKLPDSLSSEWLERYLCGLGCSVIARLDGDLIAMTGTRGEVLDVYGMGKIAVAHTQNGKDFTGEIGKDCVFVYNNITHTPDIDINMYSAYIAEIEQSFNLSVLMSRDFRIPVANTTMEKEQIKTAISSMRDGKPVEIISKSINSTLLDNQDGGYKTLEISDPTHVQHLQYLLKAREDVSRWFWLKYGHNIASGGTVKLAQTNSSEINQDDSISQTYPFEKLVQRKKGVEEINRIFGTDISVDFSEIWKHEHDNYISDSVEEEQQTKEEEKEEEGALNG